jgi:hypothetical protein
VTSWLLALLGFAAAEPSPPPRQCTYDTWAWSVESRRAVEPRHVTKDYRALTDEEKAPDWVTSGCTICREDQEELQVPGLPAVRLCRSVVAGAREALLQATTAGVRIETLVGYRVGRSGGPVVDGKRTRYGWHAYGMALDVNSGHNGLYAGCARDERAPRTPSDLATCRLSIGGAWDPTARPATTLTAGGALLKAFESTLGWRWGGARSDGLKDLMHVSPDGY